MQFSPRKLIPEDPIVDVRRRNIEKAMDDHKKSTTWFIGDDDNIRSDYTKFYFTYCLNSENSITVGYNCVTDKTWVACSSGNPYSIINCTKRQYNAILYRMVRDFANGGK